MVLKLLTQITEQVVNLLKLWLKNFVSGGLLQGQDSPAQSHSFAESLTWPFGVLQREWILCICLQMWPLL
jgi:hypothetical protein